MLIWGMQLFLGIRDLNVRPEQSIVTIGNFDGVHLGHQELIKLVKERAQREAAKGVVFTFRPHPQQVLNPDRAPLLLNTYQEKVKLLERQGIDVLIEEPFNREFSNLEPEEFVQKILIETLGAKVLYLGHDFGFGRGRRGSAAMIAKIGESAGLEVNVVAPLKSEGEIVSSSRIREALTEHNLEKANRFLGRHFFLRGLVWRGQGRGKSLGFPTANLQLEKRVLPGLGVYVTRVRLRGQVLPAVTNVGRNPTFTGRSSGVAAGSREGGRFSGENSEAPSGEQRNLPDSFGDDPKSPMGAPVIVETHILNFDQDIYGDTIEVEFLKFLREEKKFASVQDLITQIKMDAQAARAWHGI